MIALTVRQPWAYAIAAGWKPIENRSWTTTHRGPLAIHASARWDGHRAARRVFELSGAYLLTTDTAAVVAVAELVDIHHSSTCVRAGRYAELHPDGPYTCSPWAVGGDGGMWHWQLAEVRRLAYPVSCKGTQRLWSLPDGVEASVLAQIACGAESVSHVPPVPGHPPRPENPPTTTTRTPAPQQTITRHHRNEDR